ncbi:MAG: MerR family transcriptional regulator [Tannerella sp.]|jgi:DNA-binding transcriptional MerR regulator|nr:MerR family transcriptional regulator [Tannerella sp.]
MAKTIVTKMFYSIKEVASLLGETEPTLRYWEGEFQDVISPQRNERGVRFYKEKDIDDIRLIKYLIRDCGLTLDGVRKKLRNNKESAVRQAKVVQHLENIRAKLKDLGEAMDEVEKMKLKLRYENSAFNG